MLLYRIILKIHNSYLLLIKNITISLAKKRGLKIGKNAFIQGVPDFGSEPFLVEIGDNVTLAENVSFINHGGDARVTKNIEKYKDGRFFGRIRIGNNTFIGKGTIILPGVSIGDNCIIGSLSIVSSSIPSNCVYAGSPAKKICTIEEYGDRLLANTVMYDRELEKNRKSLEDYLKNNLPHQYKPVK
jgi:acetyltransferase-like isoleucine patch superfamily enzyme